MADDRPRNIGDVLTRIVGEHAALATLRMMSGVPGYMINELVLALCLKSIGLPRSREDLRSLLRLLEANGLVGVREAEGLWVAELTARGGDVAEGLEMVEGVARPEPECPY